MPGAPIKELFDFQKIFLGAGESATLFFAADSDVFSTVDAKVSSSEEEGVLCLKWLVCVSLCT